MELDTGKYNYFIFDFDGVIVDSLAVKTEAFGQLFKEHGRNIMLKVMRYHLNNGGVSRYEKFKYYYKNLLHQEIDKKIINRLDQQYSKLVLDKVVSADFIKGALDFIKICNEKDKPCFIISATPQNEIRRIARLKKIDGLFKAVVGSPLEKTKNLKLLLKEFAIKPKEALYFGDAQSDYKAAISNKIDFVGIVNDRSKELKGLGDIFKVKDFSGLLK